MQTSYENKEKYQSWDYLLIQYQILPTNIMRIIWQTVWRIINEILGVKGLTVLTTLVLVLQQSIENCSKVTATKERKLSLTNLDGSLIKPASSATTILKLCSLRLIMQFLICSVLS